jgi:metal-responsive CopG/Arc/MetJ family transcriptional regulator
MHRRSGRFDVRVTDQLGREIKEQAKVRGYASPSAFARTAVEHEIEDRHAGILTGAEERLSATTEQVRRELFRLRRAQRKRRAKAVLTD